VKHIEYTITFLADWHIGTGKGHQGHLDRTYDRDGRGLPFVGAKTMKGLLRERMEQIAAGLDGGTDEGTKGNTDAAWHDLTRWLLGSQPTTDVATGVRLAPQPGVLIVDRAELEPAVAAAVLPSAALLRALAVERPGVRLDDLGTAVDDHLRFIEMAPAGLVLQGRCSLPDEAPDQAVALVAAALRDLRRIGHRRRRGWGRCEVKVLSEVPSVVWGSAPTVPDSTPHPSADSAASATSSGSASAHEDYEQYELRLLALSPLLLPSSRGGNDVASRSTIPGSTLLAMLGGLAPRATREGVADGSLRVGEGLPMVNGEVAFPVPFSWFRYKVSTTDGFDWLVNRLSAEPADGRQVVQMRGGFVVAGTEAGTAVVATPDMERRVHVSIDDHTQAALDGALFSYSAVAAGTRFAASIMATPKRVEAIRLEAGADNLVELLRGEHRVGTSRRNDYGRVRAEVHKLERAAESDEQVSSFDIWLTSDLLALDDRLRPCPTVWGLAATLSAALGVCIDASKSFVRRVRRDSWHGRWGLPRPTLVGLAAGSVVHCEVADGASVARATLDELGRLGVGDRTAEGFGRFTVNHPLLTDAASTTYGTTTGKIAVGAGVLSDSGKAVLEQLRQRAWTTLINEQVTRAIASDWHRESDGLCLTGDKPGRSQLGALRSALRADTGDLTAAKAWWAAMQQVKDRKERWPEGTARTVQDLLNKPQNVWRSLGISQEQLEELGASTDRQAHAAVLALLAAAARAGQRDAGKTTTEGGR
jgi:CRISPR-associated protein Csx10